MPCTFSKPVDAGGAAPSLAVCNLEAKPNSFVLSRSPLSNNVDQQQISPDGLGGRVSVLFPLFRRCCPRRTLKRLITAGSALVLCSSCNLLTPTLLGVAVDAAAASHQKASAAATVISSGTAAANRAALAAADSATLTRLSKAASEAAAAALRITGGGTCLAKGGLLKDVWHALRLFFSGGGRAALQQQPPRVLFALVCGVVLLGAAMSWLRTTQLETAEQEMRAEVRRQLFSALLYAPPSFIFCRTNLGVLLPLFREDTDTLVAAFSSTQAQALRYCSSAFGGSTLLLLLSPRLTAVALVLLPLAGCSAMLLAKRHRALQRERDAAWQQCNALLADRLLHMPTVYIHQEQEQEEYRFEQQQLQLLTTAKRAAFANGLFYGGLSFLMTQGSLTTFAVYSSMVGVGCSGLAALAGDISRAAAAGARISAIFAAAGAAGGTAAAGRPRTVCATDGEAEAAQERLPAKEEKVKTGVHHSAAKEEEGSEQQKTQQQQRVTAGPAAPAAATSPLQQLLQQLEQGQLTAAEVARRIKGEIQFHNVTYVYQQNVTPAAAGKDSVSASHSRAALAEGSAGALPQTQQLHEEEEEQHKRQGQENSGENGEAGAGESTGEQENDEKEGGGVRNINMTIAAGSITGVAGASGSGKSTLLKLLTKQLKPQTGKITLDGMDVQDIPTQVLLQHLLGVVSADSVALFSGLSIRENILYGVWTPQQQQQQQRSDGVYAFTSITKQVEACRAHCPAAVCGGFPLLQVTTAMKHMFLCRFLTTSSESPAHTPGTAATATGICGASASCSAAAGAQQHQREKQEQLFREACRLCSVTEFLQQPRCPFAAPAAPPATASARHPSSADVRCPFPPPSFSSRTSRGSRVGSSTSEGKRNSEEAAAATAFSSGELQRLGIARALVKQPAVLLLDEATAHLDARNERLLLTTLRRLVSAKKQAEHLQQAPSSSERSSSGSGGESASSGDMRDSRDHHGTAAEEEDKRTAQERNTGEPSSSSSRERHVLTPPLEAATRAATPTSESASPSRRRNEARPSARAAAEEECGGRRAEEEGGGEKEEGIQRQNGSSMLLEEGVRTILLVAHSKQALKLADNVVVLRNGRVVEEGTYEGLLRRRDGELVRLVRQQQQEREEEEEEESEKKHRSD